MKEVRNHIKKKQFSIQTDTIECESHPEKIKIYFFKNQLKPEKNARRKVSQGNTMKFTAVEFRLIAD